MKIEVAELIDKKEVKKKVQKYMEDELVDKVKYALYDSINEEVKKFVTEEIIPTIVKDLKDNKEEMLIQFEDSITKVVKALAESMVAKATKGLDSYRLGDIIKKLFDIY